MEPFHWLLVILALWLITSIGCAIWMIAIRKREECRDCGCDNPHHL